MNHLERYGLNTAKAKGTLRKPGTLTDALKVHAITLVEVEPGVFEQGTPLVQFTQPVYSKGDWSFDTKNDPVTGMEESFYVRRGGVNCRHAEVGEPVIPKTRKGSTVDFVNSILRNASGVTFDPTLFDELSKYKPGK